MLRFCLCFLSFFYTLNGFSTKKEVETIKCYSCKEKIIKIVKKDTKKKTDNDDALSYTVKRAFASLSCIFNCKCHSSFLCKRCCIKKQDNCPKCSNDNNNNDNNNNDNKENNVSCEICMGTYIKKGPLATYSYFYNCQCKYLLCKDCYNAWEQKKANQKGDKNCLLCQKHGEDNMDTNDKDSINTTDKDQKSSSFTIDDMQSISTEEEIDNPNNCCQTCIKCIKDCFKN